MKLSDEYVFEYYLIIYPISFAVFRPCGAASAVFEAAPLLAHSLVLRPSAVYDMRTILRYPMNSVTWRTVQSDMSQLMLYCIS